MFTSFFQLIDSKWRPLHLLVVKNQKKLILFFLLFECLVLLLIPLGFWIRVSQPKSYYLFFELGSKMGVVSFVFYLATLIPGILKRLKILPLMTASMMLFRRHLGIFMFLAAITHLILVSTIPKLFTYSAITLDIFTQREIFGIVAMLLLFPLWLTSNDYSVVHLGKYWEWIHRLTYFALFLIFLHVALLEFSLGLIGAMVIILEIISWIFTLKKIRPPRSGFKPD